MEGFPFSSITAMIEAGLHLLPIQRMHNLQAPILSGDDPALDSLVSVANDEGAYAEGVVRLARLSEKERGKLGQKIRNSIIRKHCGEGWLESYLEPAIMNIFSTQISDRHLSLNEKNRSSISGETYEQEKNSLTLFQLANNGTVSLTVSALANSSISIMRLVTMSTKVYWHLKNEVSAKGSLNLITIVVMVVAMRVLPVRFLKKIRKLIA